MRPLSPTALAAVAAACLAVPALAAQGTPVVRGPATVVPGTKVTFRASGFRGGSYLSVVLTPADRPPCCAYRVPPIFPVSGAGSAALSFKFPNYYIKCTGYYASNCARAHWTQNETVDVNVSGYLENTLTTTRVKLPG